jgi:hypothetical protein
VYRYPSIKNVIRSVKTVRKMKILKSSVREVRDTCVSDNSSELCGSRVIVDQQLNFFSRSGSRPEYARWPHKPHGLEHPTSDFVPVCDTLSASRPSPEPNAAMPRDTKNQLPSPHIT